LHSGIFYVLRYICHVSSMSKCMCMCVYIYIYICVCLYVWTYTPTIFFGLVFLGLGFCDFELTTKVATHIQSHPVSRSAWASICLDRQLISCTLYTFQTQNTISIIFLFSFLLKFATNFNFISLLILNNCQSTWVRAATPLLICFKLSFN